MSATCLLVTTDDGLLDDVLRLAAAAGVRVDVAHDAEAGLRGWATANVVLLGADLAPRVALATPPRRDHVHVIGRAPAADALFRVALTAGAETVVELPNAEGWLVETLADVVDGEVERAPTVGVVAGSGGAGASTCVAALAVTAASCGPSLALDLDRFGPGLDRVLGMDDLEGIRWDALVSGSGRLGSRALRESLPRRGDLATLTWAAGDHAEPDIVCVREVLAAAQRGHRFVVADLPRVFEGPSAEFLSRCDRVVIVVRAHLPGVLAASRVVERLRASGTPLGLVVRTDSATLEPDRVAEVLEVPILADVGRQRALTEQIDLGLGPVRSRRSAWARAARATLDAMGVLS